MSVTFDFAIFNDTNRASRGLSATLFWRQAGIRTVEVIAPMNTGNGNSGILRKFEHFCLFRWKLQIAHLDMHHVVFGTNFQIHFVGLAMQSCHLLIHLSTRLSHHHHSQHPLLPRCFTHNSKPTFSTDPSHLNYRLLPSGTSWTGFTDHRTGPDLSRSSV